MIDIEKLKVACELCQNLDDYYFSVDYCVTRMRFTCQITLKHVNSGDSEYCMNLDDLVGKLQRLKPKPKPKYAVGDEVWVRSDRDCIAAIISDVRPMKGTFEYVLDFYCDIPADMQPQIEFECDLYPTREALLDAQIDYWSSLKNPEKSTGSEDVSMECEHEYTLLSGFRCVKCEKNAISENMNGDCMGVGDVLRHDGDGVVTKTNINNPNGDCMGVTKCQHESDGMDYVPGLYEKVLASSELTPTDLIRFNKCKKCGEFYR